MDEDLYIKYNIDKTKLKRDYILNPLKRGKNQHDTEHFDRDDLYYMYITLNIRLKDMCKIFNMKEKSIRRELLYHKIKKSPKLVGKNDLETYNNKTNEEKKELIKNAVESKIKKYGSVYVNYEKRVKTNIEKYGSYTPTRKKWSHSTNKIIESPELLKKFILEEKPLSGYELALLLDISPCIANKWIKKYNLGELFPRTSSKGEIELREFVNQFYKTINNSRDIIPPFELDIYIPELKIAFEYNGEYWHLRPSTMKVDKIKNTYCTTKGIKLITIWENDWKNNRETIKEMITEILNND